MKSTKIVEIEVCDVCGHEKSYSKQACGKCGKDCCEICAEVFHIEVRRTKGEFGKFRGGSPMEPLRSSMVGFLKLKYNSHYCKDCAKPVVDALIAAGLIEKVDSEDDCFVLD
jgi:hypothetical protein